MSPRTLWFVAGAAAGVWASRKTRQAAYRLSTPGMVDQIGALSAGASEFLDQVRQGRQTRESQLREELIESVERRTTYDDKDTH